MASNTEVTEKCRNQECAYYRKSLRNKCIANMNVTECEDYLGFKKDEVAEQSERN